MSYRIREVASMSDQWKDESPLWTVFTILAIIVLAAAIIFPMFARTHRGGARKDTCQSNLKDLAAAFIMYCNDNDAKVPSSALRGNKTWQAKEFTRFATIKGTDGTKPTMTSLLGHYLKDKDYIWCPSDPDDIDSPNDVVSYWYKAANDAAWFNGYKKLADYQWPADQIMFYEHASWHWGRPKDGLSEGVTLNCAYMDGHVAAKRLFHAGNAKGTSEPTAPGEPAWYNFDNMKVKYLKVDRFANPKTMSDKLN